MPPRSERAEVGFGGAGPGEARRCSRAGADAGRVAGGPAAASAVGATLDEIVDDVGIGERGGVAERARIVLGDLPEDAAHDLAGAGFRQARRPLQDDPETRSDRFPF